MNGNVQFFGEFDQCLDLNIDQLPNGQIQYCSIQFPTSIILTKNEVFLNHFQQQQQQIHFLYSM